MPLMTLSTPDSSISWNRVLPKPSALLDDQLSDPFVRRNSSILQQNLTWDKFPRERVEISSGRRSTVPSICYRGTPASIPPDQSSPREPKNSPESPDEGPLTRKRTASLMEDKSNRSSSAAIEQIGEPASHFCLCQPDPKIPRPRNGTSSTDPVLFQRLHHELVHVIHWLFVDVTSLSSLFSSFLANGSVSPAFILYRQHYQAAVVAQHPGLANPEISKIIGEQWRSLPAKSKNEWKAVAEVSAQ